jgi:hypothetical protein
LSLLCRQSRTSKTSQEASFVDVGQEEDKGDTANPSSQGNPAPIPISPAAKLAERSEVGRAQKKPLKTTFNGLLSIEYLRPCRSFQSRSPQSARNRRLDKVLGAATHLSLTSAGSPTGSGNASKKNIVQHPRGFADNKRTLMACSRPRSQIIADVERVSSLGSIAKPTTYSHSGLMSAAPPNVP